MKLLKILKSEIARIMLGSILFLTAIILEQLVGFPLYFTAYVLALAVSGGEVFLAAVRGILRRDFLDEQFLMSIASIGAMLLGDYKEGVAVMLFFTVGEYFQHKAVKRSRSSIKALMSICPDEARVEREDGEEMLDCEDVEIGSVIIIRAGERVPIDAEVLEGESDLDISALTGESAPIFVKSGDVVKSGSILINGFLRARTVCDFSESTANKILELVENANERKSKSENFITSFSRIYTPTVVILALLIATLPSIFGLTEWSDSIYRALTFLVISCPCALVISVPMAFFGGIGSAASEGILFKGGNVFAPLAKSDVFAFDKTGTLTSGSFSLSGVYPYKVSRGELTSIAATVEKNSNHPIALSLKGQGKIIENSSDFEEILGKGARALVNGEVCLVGKSELLIENGVIIPELSEYGSIFVAKGGEFIGTIEVFDTVKSEARQIIKDIVELGASKTVILSGDKEENVARVASKLEISEYYSALLPSEKYGRLDDLCAHHTVSYVGDGINDAPSLARADVGIAMGGIGSDAAIDNADVVIMADNLEKLSRAIKIARKTLRIAKQNIVFALGVKFLVLILGALGIANMWLAVFADVGVALIAILNSMRSLINAKSTK